MRMTKCVAMAASLFFFYWSLGTVWGENRAPVPLDGKETLLLRVLTKPYSNIYQDKNDGSPVT